MSDRVILVNEHDEAMGTADKLRAHAEARLHRAFSVFVINARDELLLQRRALDKYHSGGLWSNTCCSHPQPGETVAASAQRRLQEEMGFTCDLEPAFTFLYRAPVGHGLWEHEIDHVLLGRWHGSPRPDRAEVAEWGWIALDEVRRRLVRDPGSFTAWFPPALDGLLARGFMREPERI